MHMTLFGPSPESQVIFFVTCAFSTFAYLASGRSGAMAELPHVSASLRGHHRSDELQFDGDNHAELPAHLLQGSTAFGSGAGA